MNNWGANSLPLARIKCNRHWDILCTIQWEKLILIPVCYENRGENQFSDYHRIAALNNPMKNRKRQIANYSKMAASMTGIFSLFLSLCFWTWIFHMPVCILLTILHKIWRDLVKVAISFKVYSYLLRPSGTDTGNGPPDQPCRVIHLWTAISTSEWKIPSSVSSLGKAALPNVRDASPVRLSCWKLDPTLPSTLLTAPSLGVLRYVDSE